MKPKLFPQFSRIFSAPLLWGFVLGLFAVNIFTRLNATPPSWDTMLATLLQPQSADRHIALARVYWDDGLVESAKRELLVAHELTALPNISNVLGVTTDPLALLSRWESQTQKLETDYAFWKTVVAQKPAYRDAYVTLGALAYQLGKPDEARFWLSHVLTLDPNTPLARELLAFIQQQ